MSLRQSLFPLLRAVFRALPLPQAQRDRLRTRLLSSRKVTSKTQCSAFSTLQCRRIAWARTAASSSQLVRK